MRDTKQQMADLLDLETSISTIQTSLSRSFWPA